MHQPLLRYPTYLTFNSRKCDFIVFTWSVGGWGRGSHISMKQGSSTQPSSYETKPLVHSQWLARIKEMYCLYWICRWVVKSALAGNVPSSRLYASQMNVAEGQIWKYKLFLCVGYLFNIHAFFISVSHVPNLLLCKYRIFSLITCCATWSSSALLRCGLLLCRTDAKYWPLINSLCNFDAVFPLSSTLTQFLCNTFSVAGIPNEIVLS